MPYGMIDGDSFFKDVIGKASSALGVGLNVFDLEAPRGESNPLDTQYGRGVPGSYGAGNDAFDWLGFMSGGGQRTAPSFGLQLLRGEVPGSQQTTANPYLPPEMQAGRSRAGQMIMGRGKTSAGLPTGDGDPEVEGFIRQEAAARGIDPEIAIAVAKSEGGTDRGSYARQNNQGAPAYGPFQLYIGGGEGDAALAAGIDPRNPAQWREAVKFALDVARQKGWKPFQGAARVGIGPYQGIGTYTGTPGGTTPTGQFSAPAAVADGAPVTSLIGITPAQFGQAGVDPKIADAICGPVAATAFVRATGRNITVGEALNLARDTGLWSYQTGMYGAGATVKLLQRLGVESQTGVVDKNRILAELRAGRPVIIDTDGGANGHYFVVEGYNPTTGRFNFGESARALRRSGGRTEYTLEELSGLNAGNASTAIYMRTN